MYGLLEKMWFFFSFFVFFYAQIKRMTRGCSHERASWGARLTSPFQRKFIISCVSLLSTQLFTSLLGGEARWEGGGAEGAWLNMAEPLGHQGALAGAPQSAWISVELIFFSPPFCLLRGVEEGGGGAWLGDHQVDNAEEQGEIQPGPVHPHVQDERDHPVHTRCAVWQQRPADVVGFPRLLHGHFLWGSLHNPPVENSQVPVDRVLPL